MQGSKIYPIFTLSNNKGGNAAKLTDMENVGFLTSKTSGAKFPILMEEDFQGKRSYLDFSQIGKHEPVRIYWKVSKCKTMLESVVHSSDGLAKVDGQVKPERGYLLNVLNAEIRADKEDISFFSRVIGDGF